MVIILKNNLEQISSIKLRFYIFILFFLILFFGFDKNAGIAIPPLTGFILYSIAFSVILKRFNSVKKINSPFPLLLLFDSIFITYLIVITGGINSQLYLLYYFYISFVSLYYGVSMGMMLSLFSLFLYSVVFFSNTVEEIKWMDVTIRLGAGFAIPFLFSSVFRKHKKKIDKINNLEEKIKEEKENNRKLTDQLNLKAEEIYLINALGYISGGGVDISELFNNIKSVIVKMLGLKRFCIYMINEETSQLEIKATVGFPQGIEKRVMLNLGEGISGTVASSGKSVLIGDVSQIEGFTYYAGLVKDIKSFLSVPLSAEGKVIGVISANDPEPDYFTSDTLKLLSQLSIHFSVFLQNAMYIEKLKNMSSVDGLTEMYNHRFFYKRLRQELSLSKRHNQKFSIVMIDLDFFKKINDTYGHKAGDRVLISIANILKKHCRESDFAARYGGEEFALILPRTEKTQALTLVNRILKVTKNREFNLNGNGNPVKITLSAGIVEYPSDGLTYNELVERADQTLYRAKDGGRDRVELYAH